MILIADGGSTKCDWILLDEKGDVVLKTRTKGLNPTVFKNEVLEERLHSNEELQKIKNKVVMLHFFGAGCSTAGPIAELAAIFSNFFQNAKDIAVREDMAAAVYAATTEPGIVCILGTGSNSCYFDGKEIHMSTKSLGYILMDEASGNYFGKRLLRDYYYKKMPQELREKFEEQFDVSTATVEMNLYKKENPNTYLASFAEFIFTNERNSYFEKLISAGIRDFIEHRILCFEKSKEVPVHFIGSIAFFTQDIIREVAKEYELKIGNFVRRPIEGLIEYYREEVIK